MNEKLALRKWKKGYYVVVFREKGLSVREGEEGRRGGVEPF